MADLRRLLSEGKPIFGTDGVRGEAGSELTPELATSIGRAAGSILRGGPVLIGRDTRRSGEMLSMALQAGFNSGGIDTVDVGVLPTGAISYLTATTGATMGAVVSASHNPAADNGIKLFSSRGTKLADDTERGIEAQIRSNGSKSAIGDAIGTRFLDADAERRYLDHLLGASRYGLSGISLCLDLANGSAFRVAPTLFQKLKADVSTIGDSPDGTNINRECGATHLDALVSAARGRIGLAFDGDADRLIAVDESGAIANGDVIMAIIARYRKGVGKLPGDQVVTTVMANLGFRKSMAQAGIKVIEAAVGDRYVMEAMNESGAVLGGEQSGHVIFSEIAPTGDGLLTAVQLLDVLAATGKNLAELRRESIVEYPQVLVNHSVSRSFELAGASEVWDQVATIKSLLAEEGRVLVRPSGTEPVIRVMVEASDEDRAMSYALEIVEVIKTASEGS